MHGGEKIWRGRDSLPLAKKRGASTDPCPVHVLTKPGTWDLDRDVEQHLPGSGLASQEEEGMSSTNGEPNEKRDLEE